MLPKYRHFRRVALGVALVALGAAVVTIVVVLSYVASH
jgi:hypothetical protein